MRLKEIFQKTLNFLNKNIPGIAFAISFIVYLYTLAPGLAHIDAGELTAVQATLGIAHPTGYPLFTILGYLFLKIPLFVSKSYQANLLCALWTSLGVYYFTKMIILILTNSSLFEYRSQKKDTKKSKQQTHIQAVPYINLIALAGGLMLAFGKTYWLQSTSVEVYSLQLFLMISTLYYFLKILSSLDEAQAAVTKSVVIFAILLGACFSNHGMTIFLLPGMLFLYFTKAEGKHRFKRFGYIITISLATVVLLYLYLPIRASFKPYLNWGNPVNLENLLFHILGKQYSGSFFSASEVFEHNFTNFLKSIPFEFGWLPLIFTVIGFLAAAAKQRKLFVFISLTVVINLLVALNYDISDIYTYYFPTYISLAILSALGMSFFVQKLAKSFVKYGLIFIVISIGVELYLNLGVSHRGLYTYDDYAKELLSSMKKDAVLLTSTPADWDIMSSQIVYYQQVEGLRTDVVLIDCGLFKLPWFAESVEKYYPGFFDLCKDELANYKEAFKSYIEHPSEMTGDELQITYSTLLNSIISTQIVKRNIYVTPEFIKSEYQSMKLKLPPNHELIPDKLLFKISANPESYESLAGYGFNIRLPEYKNRYIHFLINNCLDVLIPRALMYESKFGNTENSNRLMSTVGNNFPKEDVERFIKKYQNK